MIKKLCKWNDNLLSFLCGIFSNIPISLLFAVEKWGQNWYEHAYMLVWIFAFFISIALTACAFSFTICKINIQKEVDKVQGDLAQNNQLNMEISKPENNKKLRLSLIFFMVFGIILFLSVVALWILYNIV